MQEKEANLQLSLPPPPEYSNEQAADQENSEVKSLRVENSQLKQQLDSNQQQSEKEINQKILEISQLRHQIEELTDLADEEVTRRQ